MPSKRYSTEQIVTKLRQAQASQHSGPELVGGEAGIRTLKMCFSNTVMGHDFWSQAFESLAVTPLALSTGIPVSLQD